MASSLSVSLVLCVFFSDEAQSEHKVHREAYAGLAGDIVLRAYA